MDEAGVTYSLSRSPLLRLDPGSEEGRYSYVLTAAVRAKHVLTDTAHDSSQATPASPLMLVALP